MKYDVDTIKSGYNDTGYNDVFIHTDYDDNPLIRHNIFLPVPCDVVTAEFYCISFWKLKEQDFRKQIYVKNINFVVSFVSAFKVLQITL